MAWTVEEINKAALELVEAWKKKHPDYKPSNTGFRINLADQYEHEHYGDVQGYLRVIPVKRGLSVKVPDVRMCPRSVYYEDRDDLRRLYDERQF